LQIAPIAIARKEGPMLPTRKSSPVPRRGPAIAAEVRVPSEGTWFAAIAATVRADGIFLSTFRELPPGTDVIVELSLPDGPPVVVDGKVGDHPHEGPGVHVSFDTMHDDVRKRIEKLSPPESEPARLIA
jgi:hypothetical protein